MRNSMRFIISIATIVIIAISCYQAYWLVSIYKDLDAKLLQDLQEAVRASDFEEIVYRVEKMKDDHVGGKMEISVAANPESEKTSLTNKSKKTLDADESQTNLDTNLPEERFSEALRGADDVMNVGLSMQRGIHSGLDNMRKPYVDYYEKVLSRRLDSLGVKGPHTLLYTTHKNNKETVLQRFGEDYAQADTFRLDLDLNNKTEYVMILPHRTRVVLRQMNATLMFSLVTLVMLIFAFAYIINMIRKMQALDEMKTDFTNNITHELKTPIAVTYAAVDSMLNFNGTGNPERQKRYLEICQNQLNLLTELVEQILSMSMERRNMKLDMEEVEVLPIVENIVKNQKIKSADATFEVDIHEGTTVEADRMHLSNIISNLVDNAIKYSAGEPHVVIKATNDDGGVVLAVSDNGIGISKDSQKYIFEKFYRVPHGNRHDVKGYGLGLFYVKSMMTKFGGDISVNSELGKGSTFKLKFNG